MTHPMYLLPRSVYNIYNEIRDQDDDDWLKGIPCPECGAKAVIREHSASMAHKKSGCRTDSQRAADRMIDVALSRIAGRWT